MSYFTVSSGYKGPQISDDISGGNVYGVKPEIPTSAELGIKASAFGNRLALDADVFYTSVKDYQGQLCSPNNQGTITCVPANVSKVITKGVEVDIFGNPFRGLNLNLSGIYNPAEYPAGYNSSEGDAQGNPLPLTGTQLTRSSKTKLTFSSEYTAALGGNYSFVVGADATYRSEQSIYPSPRPFYIVGATTTYNARLGVRSGDDWGVYLFGRNLGSERFPRDLFPTPFQTGGLWQVYDASSRKLIGVQFDAKF
jgi:iron complex outermembrane receptor protein